jgi:chromatin remodeling complex protein RSC6
MVSINSQLKDKKLNKSIKSMTVEAQQPVQVKRVRSMKKTPKPVPVVEPTIEEPIPVVEPTIEEPIPVVEPTIEENDNLFETKLVDLRAQLASVIEEFAEKTKVFKTIDQELKKLSILAKKEFKKKSKKSKKGISNSGFNAPVIISDALAQFLGLPNGSQIRPPQVSSLISKYANENGLKDETNKAVYQCDEKLKKLLGPLIHPIKKSEPELGNGVSIFNLNSYLKHHYTKIVVA